MTKITELEESIETTQRLLTAMQPDKTVDQQNIIWAIQEKLALIQSNDLLELRRTLE